MCLWSEQFTGRKAQEMLSLLHDGNARCFTIQHRDFNRKKHEILVFYSAMWLPSVAHRDQRNASFLPDIQNADIMCRFSFTYSTENG